MKNIIILLLLLFFSCKKVDTLKDIPKPIVVTLPVTNITSTTAILNGNIVSDGGVLVSSKGFYYWNKNESPKVILNLSYTNSTTYYCYVDGLTPGTVYDIEAWANNDLFLIAGDTITFKTLDQK